MAKEKAPKIDLVKWLMVVLLLVAGLAANYFYTAEPLPLKMAAWIILIVVILLLASRTMRGRLVWRHLKEARNEVKRVVWPTRQETTQMTLLVFGMVLVVALILWGVDAVFMSLLSWFTASGS